MDALEKHAAAVLKGKRNVAAMARLGLMRESVKRSIANLAKNDQLPSRESDDEDFEAWNSSKRNIGSIARGGLLAGKRNIAALARDYVLPTTNGKRNLPSILRSGGGGSSSTSSTHGPQQPKRNVATLARDNLFPYYHQSKNEKRDVTATNNKRGFLMLSMNTHTHTHNNNEKNRKYFIHCLPIFIHSLIPISALCVRVRVR